MSDNLILLKIGGSVLTHKDKEEELAEDAIARIAEEISRYMGKYNDKDKDTCRLILVHGAGSFGHPQAKATGLDKKFSAKGVSQVHRAVNRLNDHIIVALIEAGINAVSVHPLSCMIAKSGRIETMLTDPIQNMINNGIIPVLHGDVVMDTETISSIVSGDQIITYLANVFKPDRIGLGTNVDGVLDGAGTTIPLITAANFDDISHHLSQSSNIDVTGGMMGKVCELLLLTESRIFNALKPESVIDFLEGKDVGTVIKRA